MIIIGYLILAVIVMGFSIQLSNYVDIIDKRTSISGAFIGGVILAAITSLPELFTSISATALLGQPELVIGNILGSDIFNTAVLASLFLAFPKRFRRARIGASHNLSLVLVAAIYLYLIVVLGLGLEFTIFNVSIHSIVLLAVYLYGVRTMSADDGVSNSDDGASSQLSMKQIIFRFVLCSVGLVAASIALTYATDAIASRYQIGTTLAGALLLGVATSLPELTSSINLAKLGNFNAMTGNILGSNLFNFAILTVADLTYAGGSLYVTTSQTWLLLIFGLASAIFIAMPILYKSKGRRKYPRLRKTIYFIPPALVLASYFAFLALSEPVSCLKRGESPCVKASVPQTSQAVSICESLSTRNRLKRRNQLCFTPLILPPGTVLNTISTI